MRFVLHYNVRRSPSDDAGNVTLTENLRTAFAAWTPPEGIEVESILAQVDGRGGFVLANTDDEAKLSELVSQFQPWLDWDVHLVQVVQDHGRALGAGTAWAREIIG
jgi:hypothetical protein